MLTVAANGLFGRTPPTWFYTGTILFIAAFALAGAVLTLFWRILRGIPGLYMWLLVSGLLILVNMALTAMSVSVGIIVVGLGVLVLASLVGAGIAALCRRGRPRLSRIQRTISICGLGIGLLGLVLGSAWLLDAGSPLPDVPNAAMQAQPSIAHLPMLDPSQPGPYTVGTLTYGSGDDRYRHEYGDGVDLITDPVDGSTLVDRWSGLRTAYWGFGPERLPRNGRVWYPQGDGSFPLVIIVHGQHPMDDFSDPGYAYLGELLASRGYIVASVDENFLNLNPLVDLLMIQSLVEPDDLRGWLLLEHLALWHAWQETPDSPFYQKVDLDQIALIGHSRGGQAVAVAALFNALQYYPDDASLHFDYGYNIRTVIGIAPVDGGYLPAEKDIVLEDVNYLVLQGVHDMDVFTFQGYKQYSRVRFSGNKERIKSALYIFGANHGQFNTVWGREDLFEPIMRVFNLEQLMSGEEQRQVARVAISAFLDATLKGAAGYVPLFRDFRRGKDWLPDTIYLWQYEDSDFIPVCTFEEDVDLTTATLQGASVAGYNLTVWREQPAQAKWQDMGDQTAVLSWDNQSSSAGASYVIHLPQLVIALEPDSSIVFSLADANLDAELQEGVGESKETSASIDLTVEVVDGDGNVARLPLHHFAFIQLQLEARLGKAAFMSPFPESEAVLQYFEFTMRDFVEDNPAFNPGKLSEVRLIFDRIKAGIIMLDNFGFRQ